MRTAIVTYSNSGVSQKEAGQLGIFVLPMPFMIDGETFYEDIDLTQEEFYRKMEQRWPEMHENSEKPENDAETRKEP